MIIIVAVALITLAGVAQSKAEPSASATATAHVHAVVPVIVGPRYLSVEDLRRLRTVLKDEWANRRAFGR